MPGPSSTPPRRFRFGLRSLFVLVTVVCVWLVWSLSWIRQRNDFLEGHIATAQASECRAPFGLWLFGDAGMSEIHVLAINRGDVVLARTLFPELQIFAFGVCAPPYYEEELRATKLYFPATYQ